MCGLPEESVTAIQESTKKRELEVHSTPYKKLSHVAFLFSKIEKMKVYKICFVVVVGGYSIRHVHICRRRAPKRSQRGNNKTF